MNNNFSGKFTAQQFKERIEAIFPNWNYELLVFDGYKSPSKIKCQKCNTIIELKKAGNIFRKVNPCSCSKIFKDYHEKIFYLGRTFNFQILEDGPATKKKKIKCLFCGNVSERSLVSILNTPWHCSNCNNYAKGRLRYSTEEIQNRLDKEFNNEYELLEFSGMTKAALLRHKCGKIFKIRELGDLFENRNRGCPVCYAFKSKGEQKIACFLDNNNIEYEPQKTFSPLNKSKYRFDFYLPKYRLAIEYQGEQHYRDNGFFKDGLASVQTRDLVKKQYCLENGIELFEIKYTDLSQIEKILSSKFNDYPLGE